MAAGAGEPGLFGWLLWPRLRRSWVRLLWRIAGRPDWMSAGRYDPSRVIALEVELGLAPKHAGWYAFREAFLRASTSLRPPIVLPRGTQWTSYSAGLADGLGGLVITGDFSLIPCKAETGAGYCDCR